MKENPNVPPQDTLGSSCTTLQPKRSLPGIAEWPSEGVQYRRTKTWKSIRLFLFTWSFWTHCI